MYANQRLASMLGKARAQIVGKPLAEIVAEADREALASALTAGRDGAAQCQLTLARTNGSDVLPAMLTIQPLGHGQASCIVTDMAPGRLSRSLARETRNMLGAVRNAVEVLKRSGLEGDARRAVEALERQGAKVLELLEELRRVTPKD